jgi:hypothetical protein
MVKIAITFFSLFILSVSHSQINPCISTLPVSSSFPSFWDPHFVVKADFNSDGKIDMAISNNSSNNIGVLIGTGNGFFLPTVYYVVGSSPESIVSADFNLDGNPDIGVVNEQSGNFSILMGSNSGTFAPHITYSGLQFSEYLVANDFNNDNYPDIAATNPSLNTLIVYMNQGNGTFSSPVTYYPGNNTPTKIISSNFNNDLWPDLAITNFGSSNISVFLGSPTGTFSAPQNFSVSSGPRDVVSGDFNNDNFIDFAVMCTINSNIAAIHLLTGNGTGTFTSAGTFTVGFTARGLTSGDFNNDNNLDLAVNSTGVAVLLGTGSASFSPAVYYYAGDGYGIISSDFDNDGNLDIATTYESAHRIDLLKGMGGGVFASPRDYFLNQAGIYGAGGDFNNDGAPDIVSSGQSSVGLLLNNGFGDFGSIVNFPVGLIPAHLISDDFNSDGKIDVAVCNYSSNTVSILLSTGSGSFLAASNFSAGVNPFNLVSTDLNNDNQKDLIVCNVSGANLSVLLGNGTGSFTAPGTITTVGKPIGIVAADFNLDGNADIAVSSMTSNIVQVLMGNGLGTFSAAVNYSVGYYPHFLACAKLNADNYPDIVSGHNSSNDIALLMGSASGTFAPPVYIFSQSADALSCKDLNTDGNMDIIVHEDTRDIRVIFGNGSGTFAATQIFQANPYGEFDFADYNLDGRIDMTVFNSTEMTVYLTAPSPTLSVNNVTNVICSGTPVSMSVAGVSSYIWSTGGTTTNITPTPTINTSYSVTGISAYGCPSNLAVISVSVKPSPTISVVSGSICAGNTFTIAFGAISDYTFQNGGPVVSPTITTTYSASRSSTNGCVASAKAKVTVFQKPVLQVNSGTICLGGTFTVLPTGASSYTIAFGNAIVSPSVNTSYSVVGMNTMGCISAPIFASVAVNPLPVITVNSGTICNGQSFTIVPVGANTYTFTNGSAVVTPSASTNYVVTGTSSLGCLGAAAVSSVTVNALPIITVNSGSICSGKNFTILTTGANTYSYSGGGAVVNPSVNTSYSITGTSSLGCVNPIATICSVTVHPVPLIYVNSGSICSGQSFTMNPTGAISYTFTGGSAIVNPIANSDYSVTGTNSLGCESVFSAVSAITVNPLPAVTVNSGSICIGQNFTIVPNGASTYTFSGGGAVVSPTANVNYSVTGTSSLSCVAGSVAISSITVNPLPVVTISSSANTVCAGETVFLTASGATSYSWNGFHGASTLTIVPLVSSIYTLSGQDYNGCEGYVVFTQVVNLCAGIGSSTSESYVNIYPNPSKGLINIDSKLEPNPGTTFEISNVSGQILLTEPLNKKHTLLSVFLLTPGLYFIKILENAKQLNHVKVVIE